VNVREISRQDFDAAFSKMNERYDGNIELLFADPEGTGFKFRLKAKDRRGAGSAASASWTRLKDGSRRRTGAACWHAHGYLFEAIFAQSPESWVRTAMSQGRIDIFGGNWQDRDAGPPIAPVMASDLCECWEREIE